MTRADRTAREIAMRIVYWGPRGTGKTETLRAIHDHLEPETRGPLLAPTDADGRTLFMDFLSVEMGALDGIPVRLHLVGLPGDERLSPSTLAMLRGADAFVFVADSAPERRTENRTALESLRRHLVAIGDADCPVILQFNRRDIAGAMRLDELVAELAPSGGTDEWFESVATRGHGVLEALTAAAARVVDRLSAAAEERSGA
ncbi:MAG: GTP-binding protein [Gemmatimonadota bacterium]